MSNTSSGPDFVKKLFKMLEDDSYNDIVSWGINGDSFVVKEIDAFTKTILPRHFKHSNFASFVRQLNKYDFHKIRNSDDSNSPYGEQAWEFHHPKFQCDKKDQLDNIKVPKFFESVI
jgi:osomolarity two-component system response regulator SKN7